MKLKLFSLKGAASTLAVSDTIFNGDVNMELVAQAVHVYRSNQRQSPAKTKTRGEVNMTTAKVYKQKGTGNARHGARSANLFVGGAVSHGPTGDENWTRTLPKKMARKALIAALSAQAQTNNVSIFADLEALEAKTTAAEAVVKSIVADASTKILVIADGSHANLLRAFRNVGQVSITRADRLNTFEVVAADHIVVMQPALTVLETRLDAQKSEAK